jgi:hypothetical protein
VATPKDSHSAQRMPLSWKLRDYSNYYDNRSQDKWNDRLIHASFQLECSKDTEKNERTTEKY